SSDFTDLTGSATITRVGFFDEIHHQSGVAPNGIEVHPALSFSGTCSGSSTPSPSPSASASPSPSPSSGAAVEITEIQYNSPGSDDGSNASRNAEWARLHNSGGSDADLSGWTVRDTASHVYTFGSFTLAAGASVTIHTGDGTDSATDVYWGSGSYIWNNDGDTATLADSGGTVVDTCSYSDPGENYASTSC
ncbi:MAG TPA: lamin tail domain-containing protein, partial [Vicinamibacteria bacterium]